MRTKTIHRSQAHPALAERLAAFVVAADDQTITIDLEAYERAVMPPRMLEARQRAMARLREGTPPVKSASAPTVSLDAADRSAGSPPAATAPGRLRMTEQIARRQATLRGICQGCEHNGGFFVHEVVGDDRAICQKANRCCGVSVRNVSLAIGRCPIGRHDEVLTALAWRENTAGRGVAAGV